MGEIESVQIVRDNWDWFFDVGGFALAFFGLVLAFISIVLTVWIWLDDIRKIKKDTHELREVLGYIKHRDDSEERKLKMIASIYGANLGSVEKADLEPYTVERKNTNVSAKNQNISVAETEEETVIVIKKNN